MRSFLAALRTLVLPYGATTGARIVLDGVNGQILIYDANGDLSADIIPGFGFEVWDPDGNLRLRLSSPLAGQYSALQMWTGVLEETNQALYTLSDFGPKNRVVMTPGEQDSKGGMEWTMCSAPNDDGMGALLQAVCLTLNDAGNLRPIIDLTGAAAPSEGVQPHTVVYDLWYGTPNSFGEEPTKVLNAARGCVGYGRTPGPTVLSTTPGTFGNLVDVAVPVLAGRRYRLWGSFGHSLLTGGSGWAGADFVDFDIVVDEGAGFIAPAPDRPYSRIRMNDPTPTGARRYPMPVIVGNYDASADETVTFRLRAWKGSGAATVTNTVDTNGGASPHLLMIDDVGLAV